MKYTIEKEFDPDHFEAYGFSWAGSKGTLKTICDAGLQDELIDFFEKVAFPNKVPSSDDINDVLWFDRADIYEALGIGPDQDKCKDYIKPANAKRRNKNKLHESVKAVKRARRRRR